MLIFERNSILYLSLIITSSFLAIQVHPALFLLWPGILILDDVLYFFFSRSLFDTEIAIQRGYQFPYLFFDDQSGAGRDLGFNLYDGDLSKSRTQSQQDKWDFMLKELCLRPGDTLIDIGCGYGDWLNYARGKGIHEIGVNISPEQSAYCEQQYGIEVICANWKDILENTALQDKLYGRFDAVTFMDTVEHYVPSKYRNNKAMQGRIYSSMFELAHNLLKPQSRVNRVFISCLHLIRLAEDLRGYLSCYFQTRYHSGFYPISDDGLTQWSREYFSEIARYDKTEDYRLTSVFDDKHFGSPKVRWNRKRLLLVPLLFLIDPHHIHKWLELKTDAWMWHFGKDAFSPIYNNAYQKTLRHVTLWWIVFEKR